MASEQERRDLQKRQEVDQKARQGATVVPGGTGGKSLDPQEHLAEGRHRGGEARKEQLGSDGYQEMGHRGGEARKEQIGQEGYQEMGKKGGLSTKDKSGGEHAAKEGIQIDESKYKNGSESNILSFIYLSSYLVRRLRPGFGSSWLTVFQTT